jgi:hypothetical protein
MLEYEALKPLFKFLQVPKNSKKHWAKLMHQEVLKVINQGNSGGYSLCGF